MRSRVRSAADAQGWGLEGKTAVVIGGAGHLCSVLSRALMEVGARVVVLDLFRQRKGLRADRGASAERLNCDVTVKRDLLRCREHVLRKHSRVDILLNGAGANAPTPFLKVSDREIQRILGVNLIGTLYSCQVFGEAMVRQRSGCIINFTSVSAGPPLSKAFVYSVAKAGVANLTQNLAREWAPYGVRVNALRPGFFPTGWSMKHFIDRSRKGKILAHTPMARFGRPEELVGAVLWLCSDAASFVTGSIVTVDGGFTAMTI